MGIKVSALGFGALRIPKEEHSIEAGLKRCVVVVRKTVECGINYFDTARHYCDGKSEKILGIAFRGLGENYAKY